MIWGDLCPTILEVGFEHLRCLLKRHMEMPMRSTQGAGPVSIPLLRAVPCAQRGGGVSFCVSFAKGHPPKKKKERGFPALFSTFVSFKPSRKGYHNGYQQTSRPGKFDSAPRPPWPPWPPAGPPAAPLIRAARVGLFWDAKVVGQNSTGQVLVHVSI